MARRLLIKDGILALPSGPARADLLCDGRRIVAIGCGIEDDTARVLNAHGLTVGPGFVDIHVHGGGGHNFFSGDPADIAGYSAWAPRNGVTSFLVSTVGPSSEDTIEMLTGFAASGLPGSGAEPLGIHLEGPFLSPDRRGAFHPDMLREPGRDEFWRYQGAARGLVRLVTFAPELHGGLELASAIMTSGAVPAAGHTDATLEEANRAFDAGTRHVTHLFNAMRPMHQREGGVITAALLARDVTCELICDGAHVAPDVLRLAFRVLGSHRFVVVSDNLAMAGTASLASQFAGYPVEVQGPTARRRDGTIAGSLMTFDAHFRNVIAFLGVDIGTAFRLCSTNPARVIGVQDRKGSLGHGMDADIVLVDSEFHVAATVCRGEVLHCAELARVA